MGRKKSRVRYDLDCGDIKHLNDEEIRLILRGADELITVGGRNMLAKILKGSKDKKLLEHGLDQCPSYGYYQQLTLEKIMHRIDWLVMEDYLQIEYNNSLPLLAFSEKGWEIERETFAGELLEKLTQLLPEEKDYSFVLTLKGKNRELLLLLLEKIRQTKDARFIPLLKAWKEIEYKKVQAEIQRVIADLAQHSDKGPLSAEKIE